MMNRPEALKKYRKAKEEGLVDEDIIPLLEIINSSEEYYTTSSCSGRIGVMQIPEIGNKVQCVFLGKWHREVSYDEIVESIKNYKSGYLFLIVQSAIIHVVAKDIDSANVLLKIAFESGFKYSSIKGISNNGVLVEILSTENLNIPLGKNGNLIVDEEYIRFSTDMANMTLRRIKQKLQKLERKISCLLSHDS